MPCSTNNDPNELFYDLTRTFKVERKLFSDCIQNCDVLDHLVMFSSMGETVNNIYVGWEDSEHIRIDDDGGDDYYNIDGLKKIRLVLKDVKSVPEGGLVVSSWKNGEFSLVQFDSITEKANVEFEFEKKESNEMIIDFKKENTQIKHFNQDLICQIFQFVDTESLLTGCAHVCSNWFKMIYFNKANAMNYMLMNRTVNFFEKRGANSETIQSVKRLNERYQLDWLKTYILSGMFHFEINGEVIMDELQNMLDATGEQSFFYSSINLDPIPYLRDSITEEHILFEELSKHTHKVVTVSKNCIYSAIDQHFRGRNGLITNLVSFDTNDDVISVLAKILLSPCVTPISKGQLSIDIKKSIPLYIDFLREISLNLKPLLDRVQETGTKSPQKDDEIDWIGSCLCQMRKKAEYFLYEFLPKNRWINFVVGDDILIGLHLNLLQQFGSTLVLCNLEPINFGKLLENRKLYNSSNEVLEMVDAHLPEIYQNDFFKLLLNGSKQGESELFNFTTHKPFYQPVHAVQFLQEHVIDLSKVMDETENGTSEWIAKYYEEYIEFLSTIHDKEITPPKQVDLFFHLHMLHPNNFIQDSQRLAKSIKEHSFNFEWEESNNTPWKNSFESDEYE